MFCLVRRLHNNPTGWFRGECVLIEVLEASILSICCILGFQATIALHDASIHFRHFSQDWHLRTNKRRKPKTELKPSFLYVLVRFFLFDQTAHLVFSTLQSAFFKKSVGISSIWSLIIGAPRLPWSKWMKFQHKNQPFGCYCFDCCMSQ